MDDEDSTSEDFGVLPPRDGGGKCFAFPSIRGTGPREAATRTSAVSGADRNKARSASSMWKPHYLAVGLGSKAE